MYRVTILTSKEMLQKNADTKEEVAELIENTHRVVQVRVVEQGDDFERELPKEEILEIVQL